jgi:hypothetical protein
VAVTSVNQGVELFTSERLQTWKQRKEAALYLPAGSHFRFPAIRPNDFYYIDFFSATQTKMQHGFNTALKSTNGVQLLHLRGTISLHHHFCAYGKRISAFAFSLMLM